MRNLKWFRWILIVLSFLSIFTLKASMKSEVVTSLRPLALKPKVGVLYTPYNKVALGYTGTHPPAYSRNSIHILKDKPFRDWSPVGTFVTTEIPWLKTFNAEAVSESNPVVPGLQIAKVSQHHAKWLTEMGADFIIWDSTNHAWVENHLSDHSQEMVVDSLVVLLESWLLLRQQGYSTPQLALWAPIPKVQAGTYLIYKLLAVIENPKYANLIFQYQGKPLLMIVSSKNPEVLATGPSNGYFYEPNPVILESLKSKYTVREMWANEVYGGGTLNWSYLQPCTGVNGAPVTPFNPNTNTLCKQRVSPSPTGADRIEQIPIALAYARDHISNRQSATPKNRGYTLLRQLETVFQNRLEVDIVLISSFNTWAAIRMNPICIPNHPTGLYKCVSQDGVNYYDSSVPLVNPALNKITPAFTDDYDEEYGVTIEPGGVAGDFYLRLIRRALTKISDGRNPMELYDSQALSVLGDLSTTLINSEVSGWACMKGASNSIMVSLRVDGQEFAKIRADKNLTGAYGDSVQAACDSSRRYHGFSILLTAQQLQNFRGKTITAIGLSDSEYLSNSQIGGSLVVPGGGSGGDPLVSIVRYRDTIRGGHLFLDSTSPSPGTDYLYEAIVYKLYKNSAADRDAIYRCKINGSTREFQTKDSNCEGQVKVSLLGYIMKNGTTPLYRCFDSRVGHLFTVTRSECTNNGYIVESTLGYVPTGAQQCSPLSEISCTVPNGSGKQKCKADGSGYEACVATSCNPGYVLNGGQCVADSGGGGTLALIARYRDTVRGGHIFLESTSPAPGTGYVFEGIGYKLYKSSSNTRDAIYRCRINGSTRELQTKDANCEGQIKVSLLGYIDRSGANPLYRCFHSRVGHLFTVHQSECINNGYVVESVLGFVPQ